MNHKNNNWKNIESKVQEEKRYSSQSRRRIEFVPSKKLKGPAIAFDLNSRNLSDKESIIGKPKTIKSDRTKSDINTAPNENSDIGLFNPHIVTKYLTWKTMRKVGPGFFNDGNTCYLNSTLQCLLYLPTLTQILQLEDQAAMKGLKSATNSKIDQFNQGKKAQFGNSHNGNNNNDHNKAVVAHFRHLVESVWSVSHTKPISPRGLISSIKRVGKQFKPFRQEDAHEYLRQLLDCMHEEVLKANRIRTSDGKVAETSFISRIFGGYLCNMLTCTKCGNISKTFNHFQDLSLDISGRIDSVAQSIQAFTKPEFLTAGNEWHCDKCKTKVKASKQMILSEVPNVLVLHLKRFSFGNFRAKITKPVQFTAQLSVPCTNPDTKVSQAVGYSLTGVIVHHGSTTHSGHYVAFVKAPNDAWHEMNDSQVSLVPLSKVLNCQAYILLYSKNPSAQSSGAAPKLAPSTTSSSATAAGIVVGKAEKALVGPSSLQPMTTSREDKPMKQHDVGGKKEPPSTILDVGEPIALCDVPLRKVSSPSVVGSRSDGLPIKLKEDLRDPTNAAVTSPVDSKVKVAESTKERTLPNRLLLRKRRLILIAPFRFEGKLSKITRWSWEGKPKLYRSASEGKDVGMEVVGKAIAISDTGTSRGPIDKQLEDSTNSDDLGSDGTTTAEVISENSLQQPPKQQGAGAEREPVAKLLIAMSNRIRETSSEGAWDSADPTWVEAARNIEKVQRQEERKNKRSRNIDSWNSALDAGRMKKIKGEKPQSLSTVNYFQKFQDEKK